MRERDSSGKNAEVNSKVKKELNGHKKTKKSERKDRDEKINKKIVR